MSILILPLLNVSGRLLEDLKEAVGNTFLSSVGIMDPVSKLPGETFDKPKGQYDADRLVRFLESHLKGANAVARPGSKVVAVGNIDMCMSGMNFVFGAAQSGGRISAVSLYRLDPRFYGKEFAYEKFSARAVKEVIHELGHCHGLDHCSDPNCVMEYSNDIMAVDRKTRFFCEACREKLKKALK